jgi:hypothetical protein
MEEDLSAIASFLCFMKKAKGEGSLFIFRAFISLYTGIPEYRYSANSVFLFRHSRFLYTGDKMTIKSVTSRYANTCI